MYLFNSSDSLNCKICGNTYLEKSSLYTHAAIEHNVLGDALPVKKGNAIAGRQKRPKLNRSGNQAAVQDQPESTDQVQTGFDCSECGEHFDRNIRLMNHYAKNHFTNAILQLNDRCTPGNIYQPL